MMQQHSNANITGKTSDSHNTDTRRKIFLTVMRNKQRQYKRTDISQQSSCSSMHSQSIGKNINEETYTESPQQQDIAVNILIQYQNKPYVNKWSGISPNMYMIKKYGLYQDQTDYPQYMLQRR